ncbi:ribonuclease H-like domain-containing protein [Tanacetum coccineum]|uniref:Ribonuclease H-like domain-containing protein n=1 Tax=Tanacetum coccineum TaxID=301880 RepID=A0ABQ5GF79_9ASTR
MAKNLSRDNTKRTVPIETSDALVVQDNALIVQDGLGCNWSYIAQDEPTEFALMAYTLGSDTELGLESVEARLIVHQKNEAVYEEKIAVLEFEVKDKGDNITRLTNQLEQNLKEKEDLKAKLEQFKTSSKNFNKLINSQISSKDKSGLGYGDQLNENDSSGSELFNSVFDSRSSNGDDNQTNDRFKKDNGYHVVPPPLTGNYMTLLAYLSFAGLDDSVYRPTANKTSASVSQVETSITPPTNTSVEMPRVESVRPSGVIIEDWVSDDDEDIFQSNNIQTTVKPRMRMPKESVLGKVLTRTGRIPVSTAKQVSKVKVNTVKVNGVNTAGQTVVCTVKGNGVTVVKASAGCVWRPKMTDAKDMWIAIKSRFGGNDESKKMQKYILKQQFEGFTVSNSDGIHKGYERFQSLLSQLEIHGAGVSTEDANQKILRSLPSAWLQVSLIMRNKPGMDSLSFDDLYNNLRVFENDVKGSNASSSNLQNIAFVSENQVSTDYGISNTSGHCSKHEQTSTSSYSLLASQSSCPQLDHEDLDQVDEYDLEEMDLKWQVAMISMRINKFQKKTGRKLQFDAKEPVGFDKTKVECFKCHKTGHFARECRTKEENRNRDGWNTGNREGRRTGNRDESMVVVKFIYVLY